VDGPDDELGYFADPSVVPKRSLIDSAGFGFFILSVTVSDTMA